VPRLAAAVDNERRREDRAIVEVERRLIDRFSGVHAPEQVREAVRICQDGFADAPIREFIPILVERLTCQHLRGNDPVP
jgi:hypothetical protein